MNAPPAMTQMPDAAPVAVGATAKPPHVTVRGLTKRFDKTVIYDNFDLDIPRGELISVFGPNGCGKSTLINMIAGLVPADGGQILFDGRRLADINFGYVFQNYREALFPWLRAFDNIAYPLKLKNVPPAERRARTEKLVEHLGIKLDLALYPYQMSGGQQQLVSILRALVVEPEILFLDEPFSALDYEMTLFMRAQLQRIFLETGTTTILVSHDLEEAVFLADRVLLLSRHPARVAAFMPVARCFSPTACCCCRGIRRESRPSCRSRPRARAPTRPFPIRVSCTPRPNVCPFSSARSGAHEIRQGRCVSAGAWRHRPRGDLVAGDLAAMGRSGAAALPGRDVRLAVERHGRHPRL
jgi:NitT/TauT family transport system ATP-binding protein